MPKASHGISDSLWGEFFLIKSQNKSIIEVNVGNGGGCLILYTKMNSGIGTLYIYASDKGLVFLTWDEDEFERTGFEYQMGENKHLTAAKEQLEAYFDGKIKKFDLEIDFIRGTEFQRKVWKALTKIPYGTTISYEQEAIMLGDGKKTRAVGSANGKNPIPVIIPCHRVVRKDKSLGGYSGGLDKKIFLLNLERDNLKNG